MNPERLISRPKNEDVTKMAQPHNSNEAIIRDLDFSRCLNIEELYALTDHMEEEGITITGSQGGKFDAQAIRDTIAEVRKARAQNMEELAIAKLVQMTNEHGVRKAIDRIVQGDSVLNLRDTLERRGREPSTTNLDIQL